jgi:hypothetical protein
MRDIAGLERRKWALFRQSSDATKAITRETGDPTVVGNQ